MNKTFTLPTTPTCRVAYLRDGTLYGAVIKTPRSNAELQVVMLARKVGMSNIERVEPIQPLQDIHRPHPALRKLTQYATAAEH